MFNANSVDLSSADQAKIRSLVNNIGTDKVDRIEIAAWSDKAFPKTGSDLAKEDRELADRRASKIHDFLRSDLNISALKIKRFNMAETSNWLARAFRTDGAELKSIFAKNNAAPMARMDFNIISREGAPSRAVIVVVQK